MTKPCTKGVILAGGKGTRLYPMTRVTNKHLLPIAGKPMVYYPLTTLMLAGVRSVLIVTNAEHVTQFQLLLGDGSQLGMSIEYAVQDEPRGLAHGLIVAADFIQNDPVALILGDNLFHGTGWSEVVLDAAMTVREATVFAYAVSDPRAYGVVVVDAAGKPTDLQEKPANPRSHYAVPGLYFYGPGAVERARSLKPSARNEIEITDLNRIFLQRGTLEVRVIRRGVAWFDAGTPAALLHTSSYIDAIESRQGVGVACPEEVAYRMKFIDRTQLDRLIAAVSDSPYGAFLRNILEPT